MKSRTVAVLTAVVAATVLAVAPTLSAVAAPAVVAVVDVAAPAAAAPTVMLDQGLHVNVGAVLGDDADAHGCGEAECGFLGIRVPVYAKWHQTNVRSEEGAAWSCNQLPDGCVECCSAQWYWSGVRTTYAGESGFPYYFRSGGDGFVDLTANGGTYFSRNYTLNVSQEGCQVQRRLGHRNRTGSGVEARSEEHPGPGRPPPSPRRANRFALVTDKGPDRGTADIYFDGVRFASIDDASTTSVNRVVTAEKYKVTRGVHTLKVVVTSGRIDIDAFITS